MTPKTREDLGAVVLQAYKLRVKDTGSGFENWKRWSDVPAVKQESMMQVAEAVARACGWKPAPTRSRKKASVKP